MEVYKHKNLCTGCGACRSICPKQCISMERDQKGFLYPVVDIDCCINCRSCRKVCSTYNERIIKPKEKPEVYAYVNPCRNTLLDSSSGGLFSVLAEKIILEGGYVCGAVYDKDFSVKHIVTNCIEDLQKMRGSKYLQSRIEDCYEKVKELLNSEKKVLFSGSACQVIGLKGFLGRDYTNLYTVDTVCFGVPSPMIFTEYLQSKANGKKVTKVNMRDKRNGWKDYGICIEYDDGSEYFASHNEDLYLRGFTGELYCRPSCNDCPAKRSGYMSDITMGDLWGASEILHDADVSDGVSAVVVHTAHAFDILPKEELLSCAFDLFLMHNPKYIDCCQKGEYNDVFWKVFYKKGINAAHKAVYTPTFFKKIVCKLGICH